MNTAQILSVDEKRQEFNSTSQKWIKLGDNIFRGFSVGYDDGRSGRRPDYAHTYATVYSDAYVAGWNLAQNHILA